MDIELGKIHFIDFIIVAVFSYLILGSTEWQATTFQKIVVAFIIGVVFLALMMVRIIGRILQLIMSGLWTAVAILVVPFNVWTNNNIIWLTIIGIILFLVFFQLHGQGVTSFFEWLEIHRKGMDTYAYWKARGNVFDPTDPEQTTVQVVKYYSQYISVQREFNDLSKQLVEEWHVNIDESKFEEMFKAWDSVFSYLFTNIKLDEAKRLEEFIAAASEANNKKRYIISNLREVRNRQGKQQSVRSQENDLDKDLFNGCVDEESITKRYHQLMKTFHPDNQNGDTVMTQKIQRTYEAVMKAL